MNFNEKLQELRKNKGLTQEELAEVLYVSRTAISKWESNRGYPSIDSLKEISKYFEISIDDLLSSEKLLILAEKENEINLKRLSDLLFSIIDLFSFSLIILPLYPKTVNHFVYSVNLFYYTETTTLNLNIYWILFLTLTTVGFIKLICNQLNFLYVNRVITFISFIVSILTVLYLALASETYAVIVVFLLLICKTILFIKSSKL